MGLTEDSEVEECVSSSADELKDRKDDVEVEDMRSPQDLIDQVDSLEDAVEDLNERHNEVMDELSDDVDSSIETGLKDKSDVSVDPGLEKRLEMLEIAVDRLESAFEMEAEELRENIVEEAVQVENREIAELKQRISNLEEKIISSKLKPDIEARLSELESKMESSEENDAESVDRAEFRDLKEHVEEMSELLARVAGRS